MKLLILLIILLMHSCDNDKKTELTDIQKVVSSVSKDSIFSTIKTLSDFGTRRFYLPEKLSARDWVKQKMESYGYLVELEYFLVGNDSCYNVIAYKQVITTEKYIILDGHYDSRAETNSGHQIAPGANDNGSGIAVIIEIARILKDIDTKPIKFIFFDAEESESPQQSGLWGSDYHSEQAKLRNDNIDFVLNIDMVGGDINNHQENTIVCEEDQTKNGGDNVLSAALNAEMLGFMQTYTSLKTVVDRAFASDYEGFEKQGYTIIGLYEYKGQSNLTYHKSIDTFENLHPTYVYEVAKGAMAFMFSKTSLSPD